MQSRRITYSLANYGISEFGKIRLAVADKPFSGKSSGTLILSPSPALANAIANSATGGAVSYTGVGNRRFEKKIIAGGASCRFGGLSFQIVDCELHLLDETFPVDGDPTLIVVDAKGRIEAVVEIPVRAGADAAPGIGADRAGSDASGDLGNGREGKTGDADDPFGGSPFE
ncbi:hypothetical protein [Stieleria maiorica]|uniref:hypothetical protein n=1 Tax=Stieleria maiorica TaxID=2795974 RepID=UPI001F202250|nr:hypothetical protein [Stieleria maiorica]